MSVKPQQCVDNSLQRVVYAAGEGNTTESSTIIRGKLFPDVVQQFNRCFTRLKIAIIIVNIVQKEININ